MTKRNDTELLDAAGILYLTKDNCSFEKYGDFIGMKLKLEEEKCYKRVNLHKLFPFDRASNYISVLDCDSNEIGIIRSLDELPSEVSELLTSELGRKYYVCKLSSILSVKDRFGFSYWKAMGSNGEVTFTIRDAHNSIRRNADGTILLTDIDNNRYELPAFDLLDKKSKKRIEIYL